MSWLFWRISFDMALSLGANARGFIANDPIAATARLGAELVTEALHPAENCVDAMEWHGCCYAVASVKGEPLFRDARGIHAGQATTNNRGLEWTEIEQSVALDLDYQASDRAYRPPIATNQPTG